MKRYLTIKEASEFLGVTTLTLRNWDKSGKLIASRNPINNYRMYRIEDIEDLVSDIETSKATAVREPKPVRRKLAVRSITDEEEAAAPAPEREEPHRQTQEEEEASPRYEF